MATQTEATGLPSLLVHAARSAAQADGLQAPVTTSSDDASTAASTLTNIGGNTTATTSNVEDPMALARAAIAAQQQQTIETAPTAGTAAFLASSAAGGPVSSARRGVTSSAPAPAAIATTTVTSGASSKKKGPALRRGKWTVEEEAYANRLIQEFKAGLLPLTDGTTLRTFLSKLLNCDPMRISKKFVGNNCIGKQVFRRRTADINRLTPEQIQQSRAELSELERRFLDRVAQTNRVKSSGVTPSPTGIPGAAAAAAAGIKIKEETESAQPSPPWLQPPLGYTHGAGAAMAAAALSGGSTNSRAAAAGRALLLGGSPGRRSSNPNLASSGSAGLLAMAELQRRNSNQNFMQNPIANRNSATNLLSAAGSGLSGSAMAQIARNASAARLASMTAGGNSMNSLMMQAGLSRDQLNALASGNSLSNMMERQSSFDALMSLDFQSLQSIDNLANLIQSTGGGGIPGQNPENGMKNWSADSSSNNNSSANLAEARRLASVGRMESLLQSLSSSNNVNKGESTNASGGGSNSNFGSLLQSMQQGNLNSLGASGQSTGSLFGGGNNGASAASLANLLRADSSTGLTALRMQDGLTQRNTSVDDFLSLVASGDISHHDPLLNVPMNLQQPGGGQNQSQASAAAQLLAQQQLLAQASGNSALANALRAGSLSNLRNAGRITAESSSGSNKRKLDTESAEGQGPNKR